MDEFTLFGRVRPGGFHIEVEADRRFEILDEHGTSRGTLEVEILASEITVRGRSPAFSDDVRDLAVMRAAEICQAMVDVAGLPLGLKLFAIIDRYEGPDGVGGALVYGDQGLGALITVLDGEAAEGFLDQILEDLPLRHAITDLVSMLWWPSYTPIACGRVIDSVRRMISLPESPEGAAWAAMRDALNVDEPYLKFVTHLSKGPRHGHRTEVSGQDSREMATRAWTVMNRYIAYVRGGREPLPTADFPLLKG